jgi:hypothetical protein
LGRPFIGADTGILDVCGDANAEMTTFGEGGCLPSLEARIVRKLHCLSKTCGVVATVIREHRAVAILHSGLIRHLVGDSIEEGSITADQ